ncbi:hypothetical protein F8M41_016153 [Gigaspora margarita]|uniref:Cardiolipin synthase N-terminal domain-containing protein n=1 Tax=Gigaspora margarita TaxID=4874 RepID=A0A8H3WTV3_GIGMA|nr:hypothetical protein F8M41_016153 [Gigaspora margarita]
MAYTLIHFVLTLLSVLVLILDILSIWEVIQSKGRSNLSKALWVLLIFFFPYVGLFLYLIFSDRRNHSPLESPCLP